MITAIIIDDEKHNRDVLKTMLQKHCSDITIIDEAGDVETGFKKINQHNPQLLFLDIRMPKKNGFDLLRMFSEINFEVIFVSAFDEYAVQAFEFNALGYILKPINYLKLINVVEKSIIRIKSSFEKNQLNNFVHTLSETDNVTTKLSLHFQNKVIFIAISDIVYIEAKEGYCELFLSNKLTYTSTKELKMFEDLLEHNKSFYRIRRNILLNIAFISSYTKGDDFEVIVSTGQVFEIPRRKKSEILTLLKDF